MKVAITTITFFVLTISICSSTSEQTLEAIKEEMRVEMRRLQGEMKEACEQRMETTFTVSILSVI